MSAGVPVQCAAAPLPYRRSKSGSAAIIPEIRLNIHEKAAPANKCCFCYDVYGALLFDMKCVHPGIAGACTKLLLNAKQLIIFCNAF